MGNSRSIKRSIARNPVNVWRAKKKAKAQAESAALVEKWEKTGLLDGKLTDAKDIKMAVLIESQEKQLIDATEPNIEKIKTALPHHIAFVNPPEAAAEVNQILYENQSKQEETPSSSNSGVSGNDVSVQRPEQTDPVVAIQAG